jgi:VanZ family protein
MVWIGLISVESTDMFSSQNTGSLLYGLLTRIFGEINFQQFEVFHFYLRKGGHVLGYGMLALLLLRGWRATFGPALAWLNKEMLLAWIGTTFVAGLDEWHQTFIPSRTGTVRDVVLDSIAGVIFLLMAYLWLLRAEEDEQEA